jgi:hypothetical protein
MALLATEIKDWLETLGSGALVGIDEGGLCLVMVEGTVEASSHPYLEVGGIPEEDDAEGEEADRPCGGDRHRGDDEIDG